MLRTAGGLLVLLTVLSVSQPAAAQCGNAFQSCCTGSMCNANLECSGGLCVCGGLNEPCCGGTTCSSPTLECVSGQCQEPCGGSFEDCCPGNVCDPNLQCSGGLCVCGGLNDPCCGGTTCGSPTLECLDGSCVCGGPNQICCNGTQCFFGLTCVGGVCPCGGQNQPPCPTPTVTPTSTVTATATATASGTPTGTPRPNGAACTTPSACRSGFCADGVCCDAACADPLEQCNLPGRLGVCTTSAATAPALARPTLIFAVVLLIGVAGLALLRRPQRHR